MGGSQSKKKSQRTARNIKDRIEQFDRESKSKSTPQNPKKQEAQNKIDKADKVAEQKKIDKVDKVVEELEQIRAKKIRNVEKILKAEENARKSNISAPVQVRSSVNVKPEKVENPNKPKPLLEIKKEKEKEIVERVSNNEKPRVSKLRESLSQNEGIRNVMNKLEKANEEKQELLKSIASIDPIIQQLKENSASMVEFKFNNSPFFAQWKESRDSKKDENSKALALALASNSFLMRVEMYSSALDDVFAVSFAEALCEAQMQDLESLHLESNCFSGKGLTAILEAISDPVNVPNLRTIKLANQKYVIDSASESAAIKMLKSNEKITKVTLDWRKGLDVNEANRLLSRNGSINRRTSSMSISRNSSLSRNSDIGSKKRQSKNQQDEDEED